MSEWNLVCSVRSLFGLLQCMGFRQIKLLWGVEYRTETLISIICMKVQSRQTRFILINAFFNHGPTSDWRLLFEQRWSCVHLSLSYAWALSCTSSHFSTSGWVVLPVIPHMVVLAASQREGDVSKVIRMDYFPVRRTHRSQTHAALYLIFLQSVCFYVSLESLKLAKKVFPSFLLSHGIFSKQNVNSQSMKGFGFCFSRDALSCQGGNVIDSWLELLYHSEPTEHTCPSRTIPSSTLFGFCIFLHECFCANRTQWLPCIVGCWSSSRSLVLWQF